jgi:hypothetical protein
VVPEDRESLEPDGPPSRCLRTLSAPNLVPVVAGTRGESRRRSGGGSRLVAPARGPRLGPRLRALTAGAPSDGIKAAARAARAGAARPHPRATTPMLDPAHAAACSPRWPAPHDSSAPARPRTIPCWRRSIAPLVRPGRRVRVRHRLRRHRRATAGTVESRRTARCAATSGDG